LSSFVVFLAIYSPLQSRCPLELALAVFLQVAIDMVDCGYVVNLGCCICRCFPFCLSRFHSASHCSFLPDKVPCYALLWLVANLCQFVRAIMQSGHFCLVRLCLGAEKRLDYAKLGSVHWGCSIGSTFQKVSTRFGRSVQKEPKRLVRTIRSGSDPAWSLDISSPLAWPGHANWRIDDYDHLVHSQCKLL
jgi:hypothetical protein